MLYGGKKVNSSRFYEIFSIMKSSLCLGVHKFAAAVDIKFDPVLLEQIEKFRVRNENIVSDIQVISDDILVGIDGN